MQRMKYFIILLTTTLSFTSFASANDFAMLHNNTDCYFTDKGYQLGKGQTIKAYTLNIDEPELAEFHSQISLHELGHVPLLTSGSAQQGILIGGENDNPAPDFYNYSDHFSYILTDISYAHGCSLEKPCYILSSADFCAE